MNQTETRAYDRRTFAFGLGGALAALFALVALIALIYVAQLPTSTLVLDPNGLTTTEAHDYSVIIGGLKWTTVGLTILAIVLLVIHTRRNAPAA